MGGYNFLCRLLTRHLPKYIPGHPNFILQVIPGAGSVVATNHMAQVAKPDWLTLGMPNQRVYMAQLLVQGSQIRSAQISLAWLSLS